MARAYLGLGSNLGDTRANLDHAVELLNAHDGIRVTKVSSHLQTAPVGYLDQPDFMNAVIEVETALRQRELLEAVLAIEQQMGRVRTFRWGPRVIDIDVLLYDGEQVDEPDLVIPHPRMMERSFVLGPLAEIAPELRLPDGRTAAEAAQSTDSAL